MAIEDIQYMRQAFGDLKSALDGVAQRGAIDNARQYVGQINDASLSESEKAAKMEAFGKDFYLQMRGLGASDESARGLASAVGPKQPQTLEQAFLSEQRKAGKNALESKQAWDQAAMAGDIQKQAQHEKFTAGENAKSRANALELAGIKSGGKNKLTQGMLGKVEAIDEQAISAENLLQQLDDIKKQDNALPAIGPGSDVPGRSLLNAKFGTFKASIGQVFDQYRKAITGAGAGPAEIKMLMANQPSLEDTESTFREKWKNMLAVGERVKKSRLSTWEKAGYSVGDLKGVSAAPSSVVDGSIPIDTNSVKKYWNAE